jgi:hypothetical protein
MMRNCKIKVDEDEEEKVERWNACEGEKIILNMCSSLWVRKLMWL